MTDYDVTSNSGKELMNDLPHYYGTVFEVKVIAQKEGEQFDQLHADLEDQLKQRFVSTATWDLPNWEAELGIVPPVGQPIEQRRAVVQSKMRGVGKFSGKLLKNVAEAYDGGTVDVEFDPPTGQFTITFIDTRGIPLNIDDLKDAVEEILPAHLLVEYSFTYLNFGELGASGTTFGNLESSGITFGDLAVWNTIMGVNKWRN